MTDALAAEYGWPPGVIDAVPVAEAMALLECAERRRRGEAADLALAVYAGASGALGGAEGYKALLRWAHEQRGEAGDGVTWL